MKKIIVCLILLSPYLANAQDEEINVAGLVYLNYKSSLPEGILSAKSVVLVSSPNKPGESIAEDWYPMAEEAHAELANAGLDPVAYYFYDDVYAGTEARRAFAESWQSRGISYIVMLLKSEVNNNKGDMRYLLLVTAFNGKEDLMTEGQPGWKASAKKLKAVTSRFVRAANKMEKQNLMPAPAPEHFTDVRMVNGNRIESYYTDLKLGKLAVPEFGLDETPGSRPGGLVNNLVEKRKEQASGQMSTYNKELTSIMQSYKFDYELVERSQSDKDLMIAGYAYVLRRLHTSGLEIKRLLNYEVDEDEEYYITVKTINGKPTMRYIPIKAPVYKYYIKNLKTGNIYLGKNWDADETWQESLKNMIYNIGAELKW
jgi:hypothetical protein